MTPDWAPPLYVAAVTALVAGIARYALRQCLTILSSRPESPSLWQHTKIVRAEALVGVSRVVSTVALVVAVVALIVAGIEAVA